MVTKMDEKYSQLLNTMTANENVFVCGPQYDDKGHLRVYAYGGLLCKIPVNKQCDILMPNINYIKYAEEYRSQMEKSFDVSLQYKKEKGEKKEYYAWNSGAPNRNRKIELLSGDNLNMLLYAMKKRFSSTDNKSSANKDIKERQQQTSIARKHINTNNNTTVICDFESSIPKEWYATVNSDDKKNPRFDLVTLEMIDREKARMTIVEYKCNVQACMNKSGLKVHASDMKSCMNLGDQYKAEILRRFNTLLQAKTELFASVSSNMSEYVSSACKKADTSSIELRAGFLFTSGEGLTSKKKAIDLCKRYIDGDLNDYVYQFRESGNDVNLTDMQSWDEFTK